MQKGETGRGATKIRRRKEKGLQSSMTENVKKPRQTDKNSKTFGFGR